MENRQTSGSGGAGAKQDGQSNSEIPNADIWRFVNVINDEKIVNIHADDDDTASVVSESSEKSNFQFFNQEHLSDEMSDVNYDNNIKFEVSKVGLGKTYIVEHQDPPRLDSNCTVGAYHTDDNTCTNVAIQNGIIKHDLNDQEYQGSKKELNLNNHVVGETNNEIVTGTTAKMYYSCYYSIELVEDEVEHVLVR